MDGATAKDPRAILPSTIYHPVCSVFLGSRALEVCSPGGSHTSPIRRGQQWARPGVESQMSFTATSKEDLTSSVAKPRLNSP